MKQTIEEKSVWAAEAAAGPAEVGHALPADEMEFYKQPRRRKAVVIVLLLLVAAAAGVVTVVRGRGKGATLYVTRPVARGDIQQTVDATGTIQAVTTVQVGSQVSGTILKILVDFNSHVQKEQLIAEIDPRIYEGQVLQSMADLENARANLAAARANLKNAQAKAVQAHADYERILPLGNKGIVSPQQVDAAKAAADSADASVSAQQSAIRQAEAQVAQRDAALRNAETNLAYTKIYAPIDGTVVNRAVDMGQTVAASFQTPTLFTIAQDLKKMQLHVSTNEGDVGEVRTGQNVSFRVDAFPGETFKGRVSQVRMNATTQQNVVTYETIVDFDNPELKLFPGMTAYVTIPVRSARNVLTVPNAAIRFNPNKSREELAPILARYGVQAPQPNREGAASATALLWKLGPDNALEPVLVRNRPHRPYVNGSAGGTEGNIAPRGAGDHCGTDRQAGIRRPAGRPRPEVKP